MSLARALSRLPEDSGTEMAVRDVLMLFSKHQHEWLTAEDVHRRTGHVPGTVERILETFKDTYVLSSRPDQPPEYAFTGDIAVVVEIDSFVRRIRARKDHVQGNVAKFRSRQSSY
ncbi:MAG: hypothetical protein JXE06_00895 [Coriobacteriia bacterium]|nr:hypothetical protein [Coriobacteriia bacterium]MBN2822019.1 hypothetical protein [Coriobacteriia bacterium]